MTSDEPMLTTAEVARRLDIPDGTLKRWRHEGRGPAYSKLGHHVRYRRADLDAYLDAQRVDPAAARAS